MENRWINGCLELCVAVGWGMESDSLRLLGFFFKGKKALKLTVMVAVHIRIYYKPLNCTLKNE